MASLVVETATQVVYGGLNVVCAKNQRWIGVSGASPSTAPCVLAARSTVDAVGEQLDQLPARMNERQAIEKLQCIMRPMAPLLLEVATGEMLHQPALVGVMGLIATGLATRLMPRLITKGAAARPAARRIVDAAVAGLIRPALHTSS